MGLRDSQGLLRACVERVKEAGLADGTLPQIHISGCPSSCGTHQTGALGFRGASVKVDGKLGVRLMSSISTAVSARERRRMGHEAGTMAEADIPEFLVEL